MGAVAYWMARTMPGLAPDLKFAFFLPPNVEPPVTADNVEVVRVPSRFGRVVTEQIHLPRAAERSRLDLLHSMAYGPPALYDGLKVLTVHDLAYRILPRTVPWKYRLYWNWAYGPAARGCRKLIAVSESTRRDMIRLLGTKADDVAVVPLAAEPGFRPAGEGEDPRKNLSVLNLPPRFILHVGTLQPRKDIATLFKTFAQVHRQIADVHLVVCGTKGWGYDDPIAMVRDSGLEGSVHFLGYATSETIQNLYRSAELLLFTSVYEGFGLPVLEAMASGLPVVATASSSVPEVAGDAALFAPPGDAPGLARHCVDLLTDAGRHGIMKGRGLERSRLFSWERSASRMIEIYRDLLGRARQGQLSALNTVSGDNT